VRIKRQMTKTKRKKSTYTKKEGKKK
jgi:hypothetical protein